MSEFKTIFCPECGIFYMNSVDLATGKKVYAFNESDTGVERFAKKIKDNVYQCADCGAIFQLDRSTVDKTRCIVCRPVGFDVSRLDKKIFSDQYFNMFKVEPTEKQLDAFSAYMKGESDDVSEFIDDALLRSETYQK